MSYMRQQQPQANGYVNGNNGIEPPPLRRYDLESSSRDTSDAERSRSRPGNTAYGQRQPDRVRGPSTLNRGNAHRRSRDYAAEGGYSQSRSRSRPGQRYGAQGGQVDEILKYIEQHWAFMASDTCVPVKVALQLMDHSSLGLAGQHDQFTEAHQQLQNALKLIVNEHHQGFNSSIGTFHKIQAAIHASQHRVRTLKAGLMDAKRNLGSNRPELKALATNSQAYDAMLQTLSTIETLQLVPDKLEAQIREKRYLGAVSTLLEALGLIRKPELEELGALSELRVYLSNQEQILTDMLVEELHNHLYLKSPYTESRWKSHMKRSGDFNSTSFDSEEKAIYRFLDSYDGTTKMQEDTARNPEADTFYYVQLLIESLNEMSKLDVAADRIEERLPVELFKVLERTLGEVQQRHPGVMRGSARNRQQSGGANGIGGAPDGEQKATLQDLLTTLFAKFEAIAEGHRALHDVTAAILRRDGSLPSDTATLNRSFRELWKLLQSEIRSLFHDHLATDGNMGNKSRQHRNDASANIFKPQPRDRSRKLFRMKDAVADGKSKDLETDREDLEFILKASVPGLVSSSDNKNENVIGFDGEDGGIADRSATGHKLLVEPRVFNMGILLPPSLAFLKQLRDIVPPQSGVVPSSLHSFLDDFLINVFYPQLDETLLDLCNNVFSDLDTFQADANWQTLASKPIFKGCARFFAVMESICGLLDVLPHEQGFSQLVVSQMRGYYDRCYSWSKGLLQRVHMNEENGGEMKMRLAADLATNGDINDVVIELLKANDEKEQIVLAEKESELLLRLVKKQGIDEADLIHDRKALAALCMLQVSMKWLASRCSQLRYVSPHAVDTANTQSHHARRWTGTHLSDSRNAYSAPQGVYLPLDEQTAKEFDAVIVSFTELSTLVLRTLRIDLRLQLLHGVYKAMDTTYELGQPYNDPDPAILDLSNNLGTYDAQLNTNLLAQQYTFLSQNLHILVNNSLTSLITSIPAMDTHGNARMQLNVLVLQQSLKNIQPSASLDKSARFYELGSLGPEAVVKDGVKEGYANEDLKALVRLCWEEARDAAGGSREAYAARLGGWPERKTSLKGRGRGGRSPRAG